MRVLMNVKLPTEKFNESVRDGSTGDKLKRILDATKPEAIYFTDNDGCRGAVVVVEMADSSKIPALAEPWFLLFNATIEFRIAMTPEDLAKSGLDKMAAKWK